MKHRKVPWKRNLRFVPDVIRKKVNRIGKPIVVGATLRITRADVASGLFAHLGIGLEADDIKIPDAVVPRPDMGRWSRTNIEGYEVVRRDLPMVTKTFSADTPNWGDWSNGSHTVEWNRDVYQRERIVPKQLALHLELLAYDPTRNDFVIRCWSEEVLDPRDRGFENDLFYNLNLLQENVGGADVFPANATPGEYLETLHVAWEILPPGDRDQNIAIILGNRQVSAETRAALVERYDFLARLRPRNFVSGTSGFQRYFGAQFADDMVVFENVEYGNAAYVMGVDWRELSQLSRTQLLSRAQREFVRVVHVTGWKRKLQEAILELLKPSPKKAA